MRNTAVGVRNPIGHPVPRIRIPLACVASVSLWFRGKEEERPKRNEIFVLAARKMERDPFFAWSLTLVPRSLLPKEARLFKNLQERAMMVIMEVFVM